MSRFEGVREKCENLEKKLAWAIANDALDKLETTLSRGMLAEILSEIRQMRESMSPAKFSPSFGRFVADFPEDSGLIEELLGLKQSYMKLK